jgi:ribose transport system substrate-binding protein
MSLPYKDVLPVPDGPIGDPNKTYTICFSQSLTGSTWSAAQKDSVSIEAARHPNIKILATNTDDPLEQVKQLETCMARNPDAVLVWPHSVAPLTPEVEKIADSGVPIVGMERTVATKDYSTWVYLDAEKASVQLADAVGKKLDGKGVVAEMDGAPGTSPQILRRVFFRDALAKNYPDIKVIDTPPSNWDRNQAYKVALDFLQSHDNIDAWYVQYSADALGVRQAMEELGRTDIPIFTVADGRVAVQNIIDGKLFAVSPWTPVHGDVALRAAIYHLENKDVPKDILLTQPDIITPENAKEALKQEWPG